ncbi:hypothetical protein [Nocardiopsis lucentensis]|uniref:hypothetical protein n=1 Tax=Nocardiopsis lucentensis TaxID=53441 RepID=UPI000348B7C9|nr:hypothetical protein [Nocardiopsis lucentensis]
MSAAIEHVRFATDDPAALTAHPEQLVALPKENYGDGFQGARLARFDDGAVLDLITWSSAAVAERAAEETPTGPRARGSFSRIGAVHETRHAQVPHTA